MVDGNNVEIRYSLRRMT